MLDVTPTEFSGVFIVKPARIGDERGFFSEVYNADRFAKAGVDIRFVQDNHSQSSKVGTIRGLHYQAPPFAQAKLVRVSAGRILDVAVDARKNSPTYGRHLSVELSAENGLQLFVAAGFLHGFVTLEPNTDVIYKVDAYYDRHSDGSVLWSDPDLNIDWRIDPKDAVLSEKDAQAVRWKDFDSPF